MLINPILDRKNSLRNLLQLIATKDKFARTINN
jgi:hypothetical protein